METSEALDEHKHGIMSEAVRELNKQENEAYGVNLAYTCVKPLVRLNVCQGFWL